MLRCEEVFRQICWLEERFWPDVDGMGEEDESARMGVGNDTNLSIGGASGAGAGLGDDAAAGDDRSSFGALNGITEAAAGP